LFLSDNRGILLSQDNPDLSAMKFLYTDTISLSPLRPRNIPINRPTLSEIQTYKSAGFIPPIVVTCKTDAPSSYELIQGERFWMLAQALNEDKIPALVFNKLNNDTIIDLINADLSVVKQNPIAEALSLQAALDKRDFVNAADLARHLGCTRFTIYHKLRLLQLSPYTQEYVSSNRLTPLHVRTLTTLPYSEQDALSTIMVQHCLSAHVSHLLVRLFRKYRSSMTVSQAASRALNSLLSSNVNNKRSTAISSPESKDEGTHQALLSVLNSNRTQAPHNDPDLADLEQKIGENVGYPCRIQFLPSGAGEIAFLFTKAMKDYLLDIVQSRIDEEDRVDLVENDQGGGWLCLVFEDRTRADELIHHFF
jgi:ParB/RepB/Spo0J family partition protein